MLSFIGSKYIGKLTPIFNVKMYGASHLTGFFFLNSLRFAPSHIALSPSARAYNRHATVN